MKEFKLTVVEADSKFYEGNCISLVVPTSAGQYGVMAGHSNMVAAIVPGILKYSLPDGERRHAAISGGVVKVENNEVLILGDSIESPDEIDANRAKRELEKAKNAMSDKLTDEEYSKAKAQMTKAVNRLNVISRYTK